MSEPLPDMLAIGTTVTLVDARSPLREQYGGVVVGHDKASRRYMCVRYSNAILGRHAEPVIAINHPVRIGDGEPASGETYLIQAITGAPDLAKTVMTLIARVETCEKTCAEALAKTHAEMMDMKKRHTAALQTLAQKEFVGLELATAVKAALDHGVVGKAAPAPTNPQPRRSTKAANPEPETANA